jgi:thymidylate synthase
MEKYKNLQQAFYSICEKLSKAKEVNSRGSKQKEIIFYNFSIDDPSDILINIPARKFSEDYAISEWLWYLSANPEVTNIGKLARIWRDIADENNCVESNYGCYLLHQWDWIKGELMSDNDSRRATIVINQPFHKSKNKKDYPCTHYIQFFIRENKLHLGVNMRSNDAVFGLCNDVFTFCLFQQLMLNDLNDLGADIELGNYFHSAGSMHVYERHYEMVENIIKNFPYEDPTSKVQLKEGVLLGNCLTMPSIDIEKDQIKKYTEHAKGILFNEHT